MNLLVTNAGLAALVNAEATGTETITISEIKFGSGQYTPAKTQTAMQTPFKTLTALSGGAVSENTLHVTAEDASTETYSVYEVGVFLSDGTLFAVGSQTTAILQKASAAIALLSVDIALADHSAATVTVGDTNFFNPPATTEVKGVVELATDDETKAGTDATRAVTPASLKAELDVRDSKVVHTTGNETVSGVKTFTSQPYVLGDSPRLNIKQTDVTKGTAPSGNNDAYVRFFDSSDNTLGLLSNSYDESKQVSTAMRACKSNSVNDSGHAEVKVVYPADDSPYATAPTPADANDRSTKIATTAWVQTLAGKYLPLAGGTITGGIVFENSGQIRTSGSANNYGITIFGQPDNFNGSLLTLTSEGNTDPRFELTAGGEEAFKRFVGRPDGSLMWGAENIVRTVNSLSADAAGNVVIEDVTGNAGTATKLSTARTIALSGDVSGSASFDGSANVTISATVADDSHSHSNYLPLAGGNMTGTIAARHSIDDATTVPSSNQYQTALILKDKNNQAFGHIQTASYADTGKLLVKMSVVDGLRNGNTYEGTPVTHFIGIGMDASGTPYTLAPNPPADDDSDQIATTAWVRNTFDSMIDDEGVVHIAGSETISGAKTFSATTTLNGVVNLNATVIGGAGRDIWFAHVAGATSNRSVIQSGNAYQDGASFYLNAKDYATNGGSFQINAHDGTNVKSLLGKPDGTLTWSGKSVLTSENETTLKYLIDETQFSVTALGKSFNYGLLWLCIENFEDTADVNTSVGAGGSVANYYDATNHLIVKTGSNSIVLQSKPQTCSKNNATAWAYPDWTGSGSLKVEISRDGGTTFTTVTSDTMTSISSQPTGTSMVCRLTLTGQVTLKNIAWGCK